MMPKRTKQASNRENKKQKDTQRIPLACVTNDYYIISIDSNRLGRVEVEVVVVVVVGEFVVVSLQRTEKPVLRTTMPSSSIARYLHSIECSAQPLDLSFHPKKDNLLAVALVDGTVEGKTKKKKRKRKE